MSISLCEHDLPLRACEICREAADLLGKGDNVLISRSYLTEWVREAHRYQDALKLLEVTEKENAELREKFATIRATLAEAIEEADACHDDEHGTPSPNLDAARAVLAKLKQNNSSDSAIDKELQRLGCPL